MIPPDTRSHIGIAAWLLLAAWLPTMASSAPDRPIPSQQPGRTVGRGNAWIHVIPTLSNRQPAPGESVRIGAVVRASEGVDRVVAEVEDGETIFLQRTDGNAGLSQWAAEWKCDAPVTTRRTIVLRVTDTAGHTFEDDSLWLGAPSDVPSRLATIDAPVSPISTPGVEIPGPTGGLRRLDVARFPGANANFFTCAVIDTATSTALFGASTAPGQILKVNLGDNSSSPTLAAPPLELNTGEDYLQCAVIDSAAGYAYFGTWTRPGRVVKIRINPLQRIAATQMHPTDDYLWTAVFNPNDQMAYFGTDDSPGRVIRVELPATAQPPVRRSALDLPVGEDYLHAAVIDPDHNYAWFGTYTDPGRIVKIDLSGPTPARVAALTLEAGESFLSSAAADLVNGRAWFGTDTSPGRIVQIDLGDGAAPPTREDAIELDAGENKLGSASYDSETGGLFFGTMTSPGQLIKLIFDDITTLPQRVAPPAWTGFSLDESYFACMAGWGGSVYMGTSTNPGRAVKAGQGIGRAAPWRLGAVSAGGVGGAWFTCCVFDWVENLGYFGTYTNPGQVVVVDLGAGNTPPSIHSTLDLGGVEQFLACAALDEVDRYAYFGTFTQPGHLIKVRLQTGATPASHTATLVLNIGDENLSCAAIDTTTSPSIGYFGTGTSPGRIVKANLGRATDTLPSTYTVTVLELNAAAGENRFRSALLDPAARRGYFATGTSPGRVVKVDLGVGLTTPTHIGTLTLNAGEDDLQAGVLDATAGYAWYGTHTSPGRVVKVALGAPAAPPTRVDALTLPTDDRLVMTGVLDAADGHAYFGTLTSPARVVKVALGVGAAAPWRVRTVELTADQRLIDGGLQRVSPSEGYAWFASSTNPAYAVKLRLDPVAPGPYRPIGGAAFTSAIEPPDAFSCGVIDTSAVPPMGYFGTWTWPGRIYTVLLSDDESRPQVIGELTLEPGEGLLSCALLDTAPTPNYALFATSSNPGRIVKVRLGGLAQRASTLELEWPETLNGCGAMIVGTTVSQALFGGTQSLSGESRVINICCETGNATPTLTGLIATSYTAPACAIAPAGSPHVWFGTDSTPGQVFKVRTEDAWTTPTILGGVTLEANEDRLLCGVADAEGRFGYFGTQTSPGRVVKVDLGTGDAPPTRMGALTMEFGENNLTTAMTDATPPDGRTDNDFAYFSTWTWPGRLIKIAMNDAFTTPSRVGALTLDNNDGYLMATQLEPGSSRGYLATSFAPGRIVRLGLSQKGYVKGTLIDLRPIGENMRVTRVPFYSHHNDGQVRLGIYDDPTTPSLPRSLLWSSDPIVNTVTDGWISVPISSGTPSSLLLAPERYWLAWQVSTHGAVPSFSGTTPAAAGRYYQQPFGAFPAALTAGQVHTTDERWTLCFEYNQPMIVVTPPGPLSFPKRLIADGPTSPQQIVISNEGTSVVVPLVTLIGDDPSQYVIAPPVPPFVLNYGQSRSIFVAFDPDSGGWKSADVSIQSNDPKNPSIGILMWGYGLDPAGVEPTLWNLYP